jgi:2-polyprenyl-3-methyl-5-hydroxy-6-metoxy-1,4-benzoquinol methylase
LTVLTVLTPALAFLSDGRSDFGSRFARLRWRRAVGVGRSVDWAPDALAATVTAGADVWFVVADPNAVPMVATGALEPSAGRLLVAGTPDLRVPHTLRELEGLERGGSSNGRAAIGFRTADFPTERGETVKHYIDRLLSLSALEVSDPDFQAVSLGDPSERERPELTGRLPSGALRILDVGCGAGAGIAGAKARNPGWKVTGIEKDARLASQARQRCDRVLEGDLARILPELAAAGEAFDAVVYADVLEHVEDPVAALALGRRLAAPGAKLLVSVPNVGHLSIVRDLVLGRFDPVPAGLTDAGHLRWFTRAFLGQALAESGWRAESIEGEPGAPPPDAEEFLALAATWPEVDRESLRTYQWIATARPA